MSAKTDAEPLAGTPTPKFKAFDHHPLLALFPTGSEEDLSAMKRDVAQNGVQQRIRIWKDGKGKAWLIDGTVRQEGARRAFQEAVEADPPQPPVAANNIPLQPEFEEFFGTKEDVYRFIKTSHVRKHYTPGQKAALGVQLYYYEYKQTHHGKLPTPQQEVEGDGAMTASELALCYGVNEYYIRICRQLYRDATDLFDAVAMGVIPPAKAKAQLVERQKGTPPELPGEDGEPADAAGGKDKGEADAEMVDALGEPVPDGQKEVFTAKAVFKQVRREVTKMKEKVGVLTGGPAGSYIDAQAVEKQFAALLSHLHGSEPTVVCPECGGKGHRKGQRHQCPTCKDGNGFLSRQAYAQYKKAQAAGGGEGESDHDAG